MAFILARFHWLKLPTDEGKEETGVPRENPDKYHKFKPENSSTDRDSSPRCSTGGRLLLTITPRADRPWGGQPRECQRSGYCCGSTRQSVGVQVTAVVQPKCGCSGHRCGSTKVWVFRSLLWFNQSVGVQVTAVVQPKCGCSGHCCGSTKVWVCSDHCCGSTRQSVGVQVTAMVQPDKVWVFRSLLWFNQSVGVQVTTMVQPDKVWVFRSLLWFNQSVGVQVTTMVQPDKVWVFRSLLWFNQSVGVQITAVVQPKCGCSGHR